MASPEEASCRASGQAAYDLCMDSFESYSKRLEFGGIHAPVSPEDDAACQRVGADHEDGCRRLAGLPPLETRGDRYRRHHPRRDRASAPAEPPPVHPPGSPPDWGEWHRPHPAYDPAPGLGGELSEGYWDAMDWPAIFGDILGTFGELGGGFGVLVHGANGSDVVFRRKRIDIGIAA